MKQKSEGVPYEIEKEKSANGANCHQNEEKLAQKVYFFEKGA